MDNNPNRRDFLKLTLSGAASTALAGGAFSLAAVSSAVAMTLAEYSQPLPIPAKKGRSYWGGSHRLNAQRLEHQFHPALTPVPTLGYKGKKGKGYMGPTFDIFRGSWTALTIANRIRGGHPLGDSIDTNLHMVTESDRANPRIVNHLHGGRTAPSSDGHPLDGILPGKKKTYIYNNDSEACMMWYHDHAMGITRHNVYAGLAGLWFIRDKFDTGDKGNLLGLPSGKRYEIPLVIQDKYFGVDINGKNTHGYELGPQDSFDGTQEPIGEWKPEFWGTTPVINGAVSPFLKVKGSVYRFRVLNASQTRQWILKMSNGMPFHVIGSDMGLLNNPVQVTELTVACAERYDILVDFSAMGIGETAELMNLDILPPDEAPPATNISTLMQFRRVKGRGPIRAIPTKLRGGTTYIHGATHHLPPLLPSIASLDKPELPVRRWVLNAADADAHNPYFGLMINNLPFMIPDSEREYIPQGTEEIWEIINPMGEFHPIHIHLAHHRLLDQRPLNAMAMMMAHPKPALRGTKWSPDPSNFMGNPDVMEPYRDGNKDTVNIPPESVVRIHFKWPTAAELGFDPTETYTSVDGTRTLGGYMLHCHILEHEDNDMMQTFYIS